MRGVFDQVYREVHILKSHGIQSGETSDLQSACQEIIARFDADEFEPARKSLTDFQDDIKRQINQR